MSDAAPPLSTATRFWYGFGQVAEGVKNHSFASFLLFYYTSVLGLSGDLAGLALAVALVFDAVTDPLAGVLSDRLDSRLGRRHPFMYASALPLGFVFYLTFAPPGELGQGALFAWLTCFAIATRASLTLYHVPHMALGAELSTDYEERTRIVMARAFWSSAGALSAGGVGLLWFLRPTAAYPDGQLDPAGYPAYAACFAVVMVVTILASALGTHHRIPHLARPDADHGGGVVHGLLRGGREILALPSFRALFLGSTCVFVAFGLGGVLGLHLATYFWRVTTQELFIWGVGSGTGTLTGMLFWARVAGRTDKKPTFIRGLTIFVAFAALPPLLKVAGFWPAEESPFYLPLFVACGSIYSFGLAAAVVTGGSMMADVTDQDELRHGRRREGIFFGAAALAAKSSVGLGALIGGRVVSWVGLVPQARPEDVSVEVASRLGLAAGLSMLVLASLALVLFSGYRLTRGEHAAIRAELDRRARARSAASASPPAGS